MRFKSLLLPFLMMSATFGFEFNQEIRHSSTLEIEFGAQEPIKETLVGNMSHELPFSCVPELKGAVQYGLESITFYVKNLHAGTKYHCKSTSAKSDISFATSDFKVQQVRKISDDKYIISFADDINASALKSALNVENAAFEVKLLKPNDALITLDKNLSEPNFSINADFSSAYGVKLGKNWLYTYKENDTTNEPSYEDNAEAKTLILNAPVAKSLENAKFGIRFYLKNWLDLEAAKKFIRIDGVKSFKIGNVQYAHSSQEREDENVLEDINYFFEITSDEFKPRTEYQISILPGFGDRDELVRQRQNFSVKTGDFSAFASFINDLPYISSVGTIGIKSTNVGQLKVVVEKLTDENYRYFLNFSDRDLSSFTKQVASKNYELGGALNEILEHKIKLDFAGSGDGVYLITIYYDKDKSVQKHVYFSDIAINAKVSKDEIFVFANRLGENIMLTNANVQIYSNKNDQIAVGATNDEGIYKLNQKDIHKHAKSIVVSLGKEQNFIILNSDERLNERAFYKSKDANETITSFTHFASNIIRPNDNIKGVIYLRDDDFKPLANMPVRLKFTDPQEKKLLEKAFTTDELGILSFDEHINSELTGRFNLSIIYASKVLKTEPFFIESFVPARIKNEIILENNKIKNNEILTLKLESSYLFGAPSANLNGSVDLNFFQKEYQNPDFKGYSFTDTTKDKKLPAQIQKPVRLDENGKATSALAISILDGSPSVFDGYVTFNINDDGKTISTTKAVEIFTYDNIVGIKSDKDFIEPNENIKLSSIVLDTKNFTPQSTPLIFEIKRQIWDYNIDERGYTRWFKKLENIDKFTSQEQTKEYSFTQSGDYTIVATDQISLASASVDVRVSGYNYSTLTPIKELSNAQIKLNATSYKAGETISADVSSAIKEGLALITLEANGVKAYKLANIKNNSANVKFQAPENFTGAYVSASIYRLADAPNVPFRAYAKVYAKANVAHRKLDLNITAPDSSKTNNKIKVELKTEPNADISVFAVDLGVLNITSQESPNPLKIFNKQLNDGVFDYDIYNKLANYLVAGKMLNFGGDSMLKMAMEAAMDKHKSPVEGKNIQTFIKMARLKADANGTAVYDLEIPSELNSAIRIDVIASQSDKIGTSSKIIAIKDDIVVKPSALAYMIAGDEIDANLRLINTTNSDKNLTLISSASANLSLNLQKNSIELKAKQSISVPIKISAKEAGSAFFEIVVDDGSEKFSSKTNLNVIHSYPKSTYAKSFSIDKIRKFKLPQGFENVQIDASTSIASLLTSASKNLIEYPHGCAEQRSSRLLALLNAKILTATQEQDRLRFINAGMKDLIKMQNQNGQFGYWSELGDVNVFASIYAADVLFELDKAGFKLESNVKSQIKKGIERLNYTSQTQALYGLYVLAKYGKFDRALLNQIYDSKKYTTSTLDRYLMGATLKLAGLSDEANTAIKITEKTDKISSQLDFGSNIRDRAFTLFLHAQHFIKNEFSDKIANELIKNIDQLASTQERAFVLRALNAYFADTKDSDNQKFTLIYNGESSEFDELVGVGITPKNGVFEIVPHKSIFVSLSSNAYIPLEIKHVKEARSIDIYRTFVNSEGKEIDLNTLKLNDVIYSKIELSAKSSITNGVINEIFPTCFEPINENIANFKRPSKISNSLTLNHQNILDDRVVSFYSLDVAGVLYTPYRVVLSGKCSLPAAITENMYNEEQSDYDLSQKSFIVK